MHDISPEEHQVQTDECMFKLSYPIQEINITTVNQDSFTEVILRRTHPYRIRYQLS